MGIEQKAARCGLFRIKGKGQSDRSTGERVGPRISSRRSLVSFHSALETGGKLAIGPIQQIAFHAV
jgi:hypothetical protein